MELLAAHITIVAGPGSFELAASQFIGHSGQRRSVTFDLLDVMLPKRATVEVSQELSDEMHSIIDKRKNKSFGKYPSEPFLVEKSERESGDGESFNLEGWYGANGTKKRWVKIFYSTRTRRGVLKFVEK